MSSRIVISEFMDAPAVEALASRFDVDYRPRLVDEPAALAQALADAEGWAPQAIFNLKLPMKKRWEEVLRCRGIIDEALGGGGYYLRMKQLYHDREEVTAYLSRRSRQAPSSRKGAG